MTPKPESTQLLKWLRKHDATLAHRVVMVRDELAKWLPLIVAFYPHYPSHGLDHSDRIVAQLSKLLFRGSRAVVPFSGAEVYCLLCAAYLHDMGMVVSPEEAATMLASGAWKEFIGQGGNGHVAFKQYEAIRTGPVQGTKEQTDFLADLALRQVLADFVRRGHHERGKTALEMHAYLKHLVDDGDSVAFATISDLGVGHGLPDSDLTDTTRFPEERDVLGDKVNVRFLARLLRIGDLLDMDSRRADPMTAKGVAPLRPDATPHWQQYSAKKHENISPEIIEFRFECRNQETHRILRDWFGWLESEVRAVGLEQLHAPRHDKWKAPRCLVSSQATPDGGNERFKPTIIIKPAKGANYAFHDWKLELDQERIIERLIYDVYEDSSVFIRELIQNALDASRCQMYADLAAQNPDTPLPECPTQLPPEFRAQYPIVLSLADEEVQSSPDSAPEKRGVFTIEDRGTGMNERIITRYFLQIGRSYYQSNEFREQYKFAPTSRFGVGFLSVFAVSKNITVETAQRDDATGSVVGLRLNLREPRNYLLTEEWPPFAERVAGPKNGTRIRVILDDWGEHSSLADRVRAWCVAVEVPIVVRDAGRETIIQPERLADKTVLATSKVNPNGRFTLRAFDLATHGVEGQVALIAYEDEKGEGWCDCWPTDRGLDGFREDALPHCRDGFVSFHGVRLAWERWEGYDWGERYELGERRARQWLVRADVRSAAQEITVDRAVSVRRSRLGGLTAAIGRDAELFSTVAQGVQDAARRAVQEHFAQSTRARGQRGALYVGRVLSAAPLADAWRDQYPGTVITWRDGRREDISVAGLLALGDLVFCAYAKPRFDPEPASLNVKRHPRDVRSHLPIVSWSDTPRFADKRLKAKIRGMNLCGIDRQDDLWLFTFSDSKTNPKYSRAHPSSPSWLVPSLLGEMAAVQLYDLGDASDPFSIVNLDAPVVQWLSRLRDAAMATPPLVDPAAVKSCWELAAGQYWFLRDRIGVWASNPRVPAALKPPVDDRGNLVWFEAIDLLGRSSL